MLSIRYKVLILNISYNVIYELLFQVYDCYILPVYSMGHPTAQSVKAGTAFYLEYLPDGRGGDIVLGTKKEFCLL